MEEREHNCRERELIRFAQGGDVRAAKRILNDLLGSIFYAGDGEPLLRARVFELIASLGRAAVGCGAGLGDTRRLIEGALDILRGETSREEVLRLTTRTLETFIRVVSAARPVKRLSNHLAAAAAYIGEHYADELSLTGVAGAVYVSPYYLSHLFRVELDTTFSDYLNALRVEKAKELAKTPGLRVQEIAGLSGFGDANYFSRIFKKLTGMTPSEYKRLHT